MINLLPSEMKQQYRCARRNRRLVRWSSALVLAMLGLVVLTSTGLIIMSRAIAHYQIDTAEAEARLASQNVTGIQAQVNAISNNLTLMVRVLSKEVLFSKLLVQLGNNTPQNVVLTNLSISQTESAIDVTARATNYTAAAQLQANLADPKNKIFSKADIVSITCTAGASQNTTAEYPCSVTIRALFVTNNPFLFINNDKAGV